MYHGIEGGQQYRNRAIYGMAVLQICLNSSDLLVPQGRAISHPTSAGILPGGILNVGF
jgi:hypothetical protein